MDSMVKEIFSVLQKRELSFYHVGLVLLALIKYFVRRKENGQALDKMLNSDLGDMLKNGLQERFKIQNEQLLKKFEQQMESKTNNLGVILKKSMAKVFEAEKASFYADLKTENMKSFNALTKQFVNIIY
mmetsp:Transcript_2494/g.4195  ORF Transcript_2494/g.4195 Transcript_2494/m.4195 type:complete len:129 (+) Transcript_2494:573-959(+)